MENTLTIDIRKRTESGTVRVLLTGLTMLFVGVFLLLPLFTVFQHAFEKGIDIYFDSLASPESLSAIKLSIIATLSALVINLVFALAIGWAVTRFSFRGKGVLLTVLDIPFTISPVISGMMYVMFLGAHSLFGGYLQSIGINIIFAVPGIVLATMFVTFPYIAREIIPQMQELGKEEEEAARLLGAGGLKIFFKITLPNIKWSLFYGLILCSARAIGEFGAVSVVSGHIRGVTNTIPLHIEILYNEYNFTAAFAVASLLTFFTLITLVLKSIIEYVTEKRKG